MTFLARTADDPGNADRPAVPPVRAAGPRATAQRLAAAALRPSQLALGRASAGGVMVLTPRALGAAVGAAPATTADAGWVVRMLGIREVALGLGAYTALRRGDAGAARLWLAAGLLCDSVDAVVVAAAVGRGRVSAAPGAAVVAVAATAASVQAAALARS